MKNWITASLAVVVAFVGCGPAGLVSGVSDLKSGNNNTQILVVFVNDNDVPVVLSVNGQTFAVQNLQVLPGASAQLAVPAGQDLVVRGADDTPDQVPVTWDYTVRPSGARTTTRLGKESMVFSSLLTQTGSKPDVFDLQHYDSKAKAFRQISQAEIGFAPDQVCLAPGGGRVYTLDDLGAGQIELRAFATDAETGSMRLIQPERASLSNPQFFEFVDRVDCVAGPRGRFLYVLDHNDTTTRTRVRSFAIDADGMPLLMSTFTRGLISDLKISADGRNAYIAETLGSGHVIRAMRINQSNGSFDFQINDAATPCLANDVNKPRIFLNPNGRSAFVAVPNSTPAVRLGSYELLSDGSIFKNNQCLGFESLLDVSFDQRADVIYVTGKDSSSQEGVLRYSIDPINGQLTLIGTQTIASSLSNVASQSEPGLGSSDPDKYITFLALGDTLVPHTRGAGAVLNPVMTPQGAPSLPYGSTSSVRTMQTAQRGFAITTTQN